MTEDEAMTKWCPMQRQSEQGAGGAYNRPSNGGFNCIGSGCMMWRSVDVVKEKKETPLGQMPKGEGWRQIDRGESYGLMWERKIADATGYCGLAPLHSR